MGQGHFWTGRFGRLLGGVVAAAALFVPQLTQAAPPAVDPTSSVVGVGGGTNFNERGGSVNNIFMNHNQILLRLTGCEFASRVTADDSRFPGIWQNGFCDDGAGNPRHWFGSGMGFVEGIINDKLLGATAFGVVTGPGGAAATAIVEEDVFVNYVDLLFKRILDADTLTALDFDPNTFGYSDFFNPVSGGSLPTGLDCQNGFSPAVTDANCDGHIGGYEPEPLISGTCINVPLVGDVCLNGYIQNTDEFIEFNDVGPFGGSNLTTAQPVTVANAGGHMVSFDPFDPADPINSTHVFLAGKANRDFSFDAELDGCDQAELVSNAQDCNDKPWRDDDDGLAIQVKLTNLKLELLFEPAHITSATGNRFEVGGPWEATAGAPGPAENNRHDTALAITDVPDGVDPSPSSPHRCPDGTTTDEYAPECDLSTYLKATGTATIPDFTLDLGLRIVSSYDGSGQVDPPGLDASVEAITGATINLGLEVQDIFLSTDFFLVLEAGPYCNVQDWGTNPGSSLQGQDYVGVFYDQTDNPTNCDPSNPRPGGTDPQSDSAFDDSTFMISERITEILPFVRGELDAAFQDFFDPTSSPGFFLGPTQLLDLSDTIGGINFDHPLFATANSVSAVTDFINLQLSLDSNIDRPELVSQGAMASPGGQDYVLHADTGSGVLGGDAGNEFWADPWGISMPFSSGLGLYWSQTELTSETPTGFEVASCVTAASSFTGYVDGYGPDPKDDPYVSRPLPSMALNWSGSGAAWPAAINGAVDVADYDSTLLGMKIPNVNGEPPFVQPADVAGKADPTVPGAPVAATSNETYAFGLALHQNLLSKALYEAVIDGLLCLELDPIEQSVLFGESDQSFLDLSGLLNTSTFGFFIPFLTERFDDMPMAIQVVPVLKDQTGLFPTSRNPFPSKISAVVGELNTGDVGVFSSSATQADPRPRIMTGGINQFDPLKNRFRGAISTSTVQNFWPDFSVVIPHLLLNFFVYDETGGVQPGVKKRSFALDVGINLGLNIDIVRDLGNNDTVLDGNPNLQPGRPAYTGTDFPVGCRESGPVAAVFPCEITDVFTRLIVQLGGIADPELNAILVFDEIASVFVDAADGTTSTVTQDAAPSDAPNDVTAFEDSISNLIGLLLSGELSAFVEIGLDPAALLNIPLILSVPYIGPSYVWNDEASTAGQGVLAGDPDEDMSPELGCGTDAAPAACEDPVLVSADNVNRDVSDNDLNGFGDYLNVAAGVDVSRLTGTFLLRLIDSLVEPNTLGIGGYDNCEIGADPQLTCVSQGFTNPFADLLGGVGGAPSAAAEDGFQIPNEFRPPETRIKGLVKAHATETLIEYDGSHHEFAPEDLLYSYRVDGGVWTPWVDAKTARIPGLLEGRHVFEVRAMDPRKNVDFTPARKSFVVDSVAPKARVLGDRIQGSNARFLVDASDAQTLSEDVRVSWRLNGGEWSAFSYNKEVQFQAAPGQHTLEVRAMDDAGNVSTTELNVGVRDSGFGCAVAGGETDTANGAINFALMLLVPALLFWRRRRA